MLESTILNKYTCDNCSAKTEGQKLPDNWFQILLWSSVNSAKYVHFCSNCRNLIFFALERYLLVKEN